MLAAASVTAMTAIVMPAASAATLQGFRYTFVTTVTNAAPGAGNAPAAGVPVAIRVPGTSVSCSATTNAHGVAVCSTNPLLVVLGQKGYTAMAGASANFVAGAVATGVIRTL